MKSAHRTRLRRVLVTIALALGLWMIGSPNAHAWTCQETLTDSGIAWTGSSAVLVATPGAWNGGDLNYFWQEADTSKWHKEVVATGNACPSNSWDSVATGYMSSAIASTGDSVVIIPPSSDNAGAPAQT